jgi:histidinol-phosphatase (PHP family)
MHKNDTCACKFRQVLECVRFAPLSLSPPTVAPKSAFPTGTSRFRIRNLESGIWNSFVIGILSFVIPPTMPSTRTPTSSTFIRVSFPADYHMHTPLCRHAIGEPVEYAAQAVKVGLNEIGFSDHSPMRQDDFDEWRMYDRQLDEYVEKVRRAQREFPQLTIKLALEVDYIPGHESWIRELAARHPWDYFIGSVHYVSETWDLDNPQKLSEWKKRDPFEVWSVYFDRLTQAAASGLFEIIGHADLAKKFCFYPKEDCTPMFRKFLKTCATHDVAIEINTAGLRKDCKELYPSQSILNMAASIGVPLTFGSDAHAPSEVGMNFPEALASARLAGFKQYCTFTQRQRTIHPL